MTTLIDTIKPTETYIESLLPLALDGRTEEVFLVNYLENLVKRVSSTRFAYRAFGPWWPAVKTLLLERANTKFGQVVESDVAEIYSLSRPALTVIAAHLYADDRTENDAVFSAVHLLPVMPSADDTEPYLYVSYDESIEKRRF
ncbi:olxA [Pantoea agglomerans]|uniref:olxA n=1 Tax=Enterobacter agglomerans TaxID=549 RepID=UPI0017813433|nr:olxA [Pantoea agglomerans]MBD8156007.1 olxA [Pantoea agglomerans]WNK51600.1 olxA [Pantoea agglomerans]